MTISRDSLVEIHYITYLTQISVIIALRRVRLLNNGQQSNLITSIFIAPPTNEQMNPTIFTKLDVIIALRGIVVLQFGQDGLVAHQHCHRHPKQQ